MTLKLRDLLKYQMNRQTETPESHHQPAESELPTLSPGEERLLEILVKPYKEQTDRDRTDFGRLVERTGPGLVEHERKTDIAIVAVDQTFKEVAAELSEAQTVRERTVARRKGYDKLSNVLDEFGRSGPEQSVAVLFGGMRELYRDAAVEGGEDGDQENLTGWQKKYHVAKRQRASSLHKNSSDPEYKARQDTLAAFTGNPSAETWDAVTELARAEDRHGELNTVELAPLRSVHGQLKDGPIIRLPAEALIELADRVRNETDSVKRYEIVMETSPTGQSWFETLPSFRSKSIEYAVRRTVHGLLEEGASWEQGLDLGSGTGELAAELAKDCESVTVVDRVEPMLKASKERHGEEIEHVNADVTDLPFPDNRFDLITSTGLAGSLDRESAIKYYREIGRVLRDGGVYLDGHYADQDHPELEALAETWKDALGDMIVDTVSGKTEKTDHLSEDEIIELLGEYGITLTNGKFHGTTVRIFAKRAHLEKKDFSAHPTLVKN